MRRIALLSLPPSHIVHRLVGGAQSGRHYYERRQRRGVQPVQTHSVALGFSP